MNIIADDVAFAPQYLMRKWRAPCKQIKATGDLGPFPDPKQIYKRRIAQRWPHSILRPSRDQLLDRCDRWLADRCSIERQSRRGRRLDYAVSSDESPALFIMRMTRRFLHR